jgi:hypothetical protein
MSAPEEIWKLAQERASARESKDFARADRLRHAIEIAGWEVIDVSGNFELRRKVRYSTFENIGQLKPFIPGEIEICIGMIVEDFQTDAVTAIRSIRKFSDVPIAIICFGGVGLLEEEIDSRLFLVQISENCGWGAAVNALLRSVLSTYVVIMDPSTRFTGDAITPVLHQLRHGDYAAVGWRGGLVNIEDEWRSVEDKGVGEVDVLFSYFLAVDRESALEAGGFNSRAIYYRNADIEFSLRLRHANGRLLQMELPLEQDRHHGYHDVEATYRQVQSKKNYDRVLERFRGKNAILSPRR